MQTKEQLLEEKDQWIELIRALYDRGPQTAPLVAHASKRLNWIHDELCIRQIFDDRPFDEDIKQASLNFRTGDDR